MLVLIPRLNSYYKKKITLPKEFKWKDIKKEYITHQKIDLMKHALQLRYLDLFYMIDYVIKNSKNFEDERKPSFDYCDETDKLNGKLK